MRVSVVQRIRAAIPFQFDAQREISILSRIRSVANLFLGERYSIRKTSGIRSHEACLAIALAPIRTARKKKDGKSRYERSLRNACYPRTIPFCFRWWVA